jgi:hypothetical protein
VVWRSYGPSEHVHTVQRAEDSVSIKNEGANQGDGVLTGR